MGQFNAAYQEARRRHPVWRMAFAWLPHRCDLTHRRIWLEYAYCATFMYTGPGEPVYEKIWRDRNEHLIDLLKGNSV